MMSKHYQLLKFGPTLKKYKKPQKPPKNAVFGTFLIFEIKFQF